VPARRVIQTNFCSELDMVFSQVLIKLSFVLPANGTCNGPAEAEVVQADSRSQMALRDKN
ncbi:MAG TPA: hypothetical protein VI386_13235, partial [Candidatus Sulfotelmatobacter sp.]